jgi:hypothetical protein
MCVIEIACYKMQCTIYIALHKVDIQVNGRQVSGKRDVGERLDMLYGERGKCMAPL